MTLTKPRTFLIFMLLALATIVYVVVYSPHSLTSHPEAAQINQSFCQNPPKEVWKKDNIFYLLCLLDNSKWALSVRTKDCGVWEVITSFIKGNGTHTEAVQYLDRCGATRVKKSIPDMK
jgi:hypothetical protein